MLQRPLDVGVEALVKHDPSLDSIDSLCRKDFAMYGSYFGIEFGRPDPDTFEMRVDRCFFQRFSGQRWCWTHAEVEGDVAGGVAAGGLGLVDPAGWSPVR